MRVLPIIVSLLAAVLLTGWVLSPARAEPPPAGASGLELGVSGASPWSLQARRRGEGIFRRFSEEPERLSNQFRIFEVPVAIRPQTQPDAEIEENLGLGYVVGYYPRNPIFTAFGFNIARMEWRPKDPNIESVDVKQIDITQSLNFRIKRLFALSVGLGLGLMDGLVLYTDGTFAHEVIPYIPFQFGAIVPLGDTLLLSLRAVHTPYFGSGDVIGHGRAVLGLGYYF